MIGLPYMPYFPGFLYCLKYLGFDFVFMCSPISVGHQFLMFSKRSRGTLNQSNIEILSRKNSPYGHPIGLFNLLLGWRTASMSKLLECC